MAQNFVTGVPSTNSLATSQEVRDSLAALLSNNEGALPPGYLVQGSTYFGQRPDTNWSGGGHLHVVKEYGTYPYIVAPVGSAPITILGSATLPGVDGNTIGPTVRVGNSNLLGGNPNGDVGMYFGNSEMRIWFSVSLPPSYAVARIWNADDMNEPALVSPDGRLLGKSWETLPPGADYLEYAPGSPAVMFNGPSFPMDLRMVDVEKKTNTYSFVPFQNQDHVVIPGDSGDLNAFKWWEAQQGLLHYELLENGIYKDLATFKVIPITYDGDEVSFVVYNLSTQQTDLTPFILNGWYELKVTKGV